MNELESYYQQNSGTIESMGFQERQKTQEKVGALNVYEAKADAEEAGTSQDEKQDESGGGIGLGGGLLTKEGIEQVGKRIIGKAKSFAQDKIQSAVDDIKTSVQATRNQSVLDKDAPSEDAPVANQPDIVASELDTPQKLQSAQNTLKARIQNMDSETQKAVKQNVESDPNWNSDVAVDDLAGRQKNVEALNTHVQNASKDPNTRFQDDDLGAENIAVEDTTQTLAQPVLGSSGTGVFTGTQAGSVPTSTGGTSITSIVDNNTANLANKAEGLTQKTMDTLSDKVGVDFGDLTAKEVGTSLVSTMAESGIGEAVGTVTAGLGAIGGALSFLGPLGMIAGLGASIAGLIKGHEEKKELQEKQANITSMASNINSTAGMSFGSIASTNLDTSQFRSGGLGSNF
jgi:hypothetical protein